MSTEANTFLENIAMINIIFDYTFELIAYRGGLLLAKDGQGFHTEGMWETPLRSQIFAYLPSISDQILPSRVPPLNLIPSPTKD